MPTGPGNPHPVHGAQLGVFTLHITSGGAYMKGVVCLFRNENGSTHAMGLRHNEHAVGARRMRNYLIQLYPGGSGQGARGDEAPHVLVHYFARGKEVTTR